MTEDQQDATPGCTCTGGPYLHGPEGLRRALRDIGATPHPDQPDRLPATGRRRGNHP